jgi:hypothetical protein
MGRNQVRGPALAGLIASQLLATAAAGERVEGFDKDPGREGRNHHSDRFPARTVRQDFGFRPTHRAGGRTAGEVGGVLAPAAEPASYATAIAVRRPKVAISDPARTAMPPVSPDPAC